jgi:hypothetical protein
MFNSKYSCNYISVKIGEGMAKEPIDYDKHGHCVVCHEDMLYTEVIDNVPQKRLGPLYSEVEYLLDDGSKMRVAVCRNCKNELKDDDEEKKRIMDCVFKGWKHEVESIATWDREKKEEHLKKYSKRKIISRSEGIGKDVIAKRLKKFKEKNK